MIEKKKIKSDLKFFVGSHMHVDPEDTDAFNALIQGEKWWVSLPKDMYEFKDEYSCEKFCSEDLKKGVKNFQNTVGLWYIHMLPQLRYLHCDTF